MFRTYVYGGTANTTKTTNGVGLIRFIALEHDGAGSLANITADGNVFSIEAQVGGSVVTRFLVDEDGDMYSVTAGTTFDDFDDLALVEAYDRSRDDVRRDYADFCQYNEAHLVACGVLGAPLAEGGMTNVTQLQRLHNGAIRQIGGITRGLQETVLALQEQVTLLEGELRLLRSGEAT